MRHLSSFLRSYRDDDRGAIAVIFALTAMIVFGIAGAAIDVTRRNAEMATIQAAVDSAAIAGARAIALDSGDPLSIATKMFEANTNSAADSANTPTISSFGDTGIQVSASSGVPTTFLSLFGIQELGVSASAYAEPAYDEIETPNPPGGDVCILLMDPTKHHSLLLNGSSFAVAPSCEVHVKSSRLSDAAMINSNVTFDVKKICVEGTTRMHGGSKGVIGPVEDSCNTADDPFHGTLPVPAIGACKKKQNFKGNKASLTPGTYCGDWNFNGNIKTIELADGLYVFNNARWKFNGNLTGDNVTIYYADSNSYMQLNGQASINIQAPEAGTYSGILIFESPAITNTTQITINGGQDAVIRGLVYLPSRDMTWNGNSGVTSDELTMVFNSLILNGNTTWRVQPFTPRGIQAPGSGGGTTKKIVSGVRLYNSQQAAQRGTSGS